MVVSQNMCVCVCVCVNQTCLVYAIGVENYPFEAQTTHLCLHYMNYANDFVWLCDTDKCDLVLLFDVILFFDTAAVFKRYVGPLRIRAHQVLQ